MNTYNFKEVESKWQNIWLEKGCKIDNNSMDSKYYCLTMFSYPSGDKLHIGHWYNYGPVDSYARFMKMMGKNVFQPQGFDAFGLPAENFAIKHGVHPSISTENNVSKMKKQLHSIGAMFDWSNELNTSNPEYYKWTQRLFLLLYENGLAYQKEAPVNWCAGCKTVLANEQVKDGECERCASKVSKKELKQWFFKITDYADELLEKLDDLNWPNKTKQMQKNWIGKSVGTSINFQIENFDYRIDIFTTRPDTIYGVTYIVLAPEHPIIDKLLNGENRQELLAYIDETKKKTEIERTSVDINKSGVFSGHYCIHPLTNNKIPIWIGDYVIASYGTGAVMAVPGSDQRDFEFAKKYNLPILQVVSKSGEESKHDLCYPDFGISINSDKYSGMKSQDVIDLINKELEIQGIGKATIQYKLHDWLISRQRYWGAPIPIIHCETCGSVPIEINNLPLLLPDNIELSKTYGEDLSPLAASDEYINTICPKCSGNAKRDADTMDTFVCSSWYYLRYPNANYADDIFDPNSLDWLPVDSYIGGSEHATMHLLYARFITKALRDCGLLNFDEPFKRLYHQGTITKDGSKMSKSRGNTVSPDKFIDLYGSDIFRAYLMFMGPYDEGGDWNDKGITGISRFLNKIWRFGNLKYSDSSNEDDTKVIHRTIKSVKEDLGKMKFNTAISRLMECMNYFNSHKEISKEIKLLFIKIIAPIMPHIAEELWEINKGVDSIFNQKYPEYNVEYLKTKNVTIAIQVNGKLRGKVDVPIDSDNNTLLDSAKNNENVISHMKNKKIIKEIIVPNKLINFVVK